MTAPTGPRLLLLVAMLDVGLIAGFSSSLDAGEPTTLETLRPLARWTARLAVPWFLLAFAASSLQRIWPTPLSRWAMRERRWLGLSFALAHTVHFAVLVSMAVGFGDRFVAEPPVASLVVGGIAYAMIWIMAATSNDAAVARLGRARWRRIHVFGSYWIWLALLFGTLPRAAANPAWYAVTAGLVGVVALRFVAAGRARRRPG